MNSKYKKLEHFVKVSNIIKYTLGLPLILFNTLKFYKRLFGAYNRLYVAIAIEPKNIKEELIYIERLKEGLKILWKPNRLEVKQ